MAPSIDHTTAPLSTAAVDVKLFPDGLKTSGQHEPIFELLRPYSEFPTEIAGETVWKAEDYQNNPERWVHVFSPEEIAELSDAADKFIADKLPLHGITQQNFPLPKLSVLFSSIRNEILNGKGFILFKGFPTAEWGPVKSGTAYMGLGTYFGYFVSQNNLGHILGHVQNLGDDPTQIDRVRIYRTNARQFFHTDASDLVGLLCMHKAKSGGESDIVSTHHLWNTLQKERPDVAELMASPVWYLDRKGEKSEGQGDWIRDSLFFMEKGDNPRLVGHFDPMYVKSLGRFSDKGLIPPLSPAQQEAIAVFEETCLRLRLHMILEPGDIQLLSNQHIFHARTEYEDHAPPAPRRQLMRLWLATPESEGGWKLPYHDSHEKKRGGIQVDNTPPRCPFDGE